MPLRFFADESCDFSVVRALRSKGHDVLAVGEFMSRSEDSEVLAQAHRENRILLTEDKDFGWLVYVSKEDAAGVILIRFPSDLRMTLAESVCTLVEKYKEDLGNSFSVIEPGYIRINSKTRKDKF